MEEKIMNINELINRINEAQALAYQQLLVVGSNQDVSGDNL